MFIGFRDSSGGREAGGGGGGGRASSGRGGTDGNSMHSAIKENNS